MKAIELEKVYNPKTFEDRIYTQWKESGLFKPESGNSANAAGAVHATSADKHSFTIVIPPPNVTGVLHLGHGLNSRTLSSVFTA